MSKAKDPNNPQHDIEFAHYGEASYDLMPSGSNVLTLGWVVEGSGQPIVAGQKGSFPVYLDCSIEKVSLLSDVSGSCVVDIQKDTYANYPPNSGDSITASSPPTLSSANKYQDSTLTGWTLGITAGDVLRFQVISSSTITQLTCALQLRRT